MHRPARSTSIAATIVSALTRLASSALLLATLVGIPVVVLTVVGLPSRQQLADLTSGGRVDGDVIVGVGVIVFAALWMWFAGTAIAEIGRVLRWRMVPRTALAQVPPTPAGAIRRIVRIAMISTSAVVGSNLAALAGSNSGRHVSAAPTAAAPISIVVADFDQSNVASGPSTIRSNGRDTPYSVAARLGDATLRQRIIELNLGAPTGEGQSWNGGVFPPGMNIAVPAGTLPSAPVSWSSYSVEPGDSVYRIATRLAGGDNRRVRDLADAIIERNLGRVMVDGVVFDDPSLVRIGWQLEVPATSAMTPTVGAGTHVVTAGESYWSIAEDHLAGASETGDPAPADIATLTRSLIDRNSPLLDHSMPTMLHPGDHVVVIDLSDEAEADGVLEVTFNPPVAEAADETVLLPTAIETADSAVSAMPVIEPASDPVHAPVLSITDIPAVAASNAPAANGRPVAVPTRIDAPAHEVDVERDGTSNRAPMTTSLGAAVLLCAGALGLVESRRRQQLRRARLGTRIPQPKPREMTTERMVRSLDATQRAVRLDLALRSAGHCLVGTGGYILGAITDADGGLQVLLDRPGHRPLGPWEAVDRADRWRLSAHVDNEELAATARLAGQPCPAVVHLGTVIIDDGAPTDGELFLDLEAFGLLCVDAGDRANAADRDKVVQAIAASLSASPVGETMRLITHGLDPLVHFDNPNAETARDLDEALDLAASALGSTATATNGRRTAELRARGLGGEAWEPVVVVSAAAEHDPRVLSELLEVTRGGGRGLAVVLGRPSNGRPLHGASLTLQASATGWQLDRLGLAVIPVGLDLSQLADVHRLIDVADDEVTADDDHDCVAGADDVPGCAIHPILADIGVGLDQAWMPPEHALMVRVMGPVDVVDATGTPVSFERGKSLELIVWLSLHREQSTRSGARTALWELDVRDATFANVVSDARRSLARAVAPGDDHEWIGRTLTEQLPLDRMVISDAELLRARVEAARHLAPRAAIDVLRPGVALLREMPFAGTGYLWPDAEGITSMLTLLATGAATTLAGHYLALNDIDGVFWATGQGLKVLAGHEELIGLRMRAHAHRGDLAGVRQEWEGYERAIIADTWSDGEPSPKLVAIRRTLLSG
jgi:LysM domain